MIFSVKSLIPLNQRTDKEVKCLLHSAQKDGWKSALYNYNKDYATQ